MPLSYFPHILNLHSLNLVLSQGLKMTQRQFFKTKHNFSEHNIGRPNINSWQGQVFVRTHSDTVVPRPDTFFFYKLVVSTFHVNHDLTFSVFCQNTASERKGSACIRFEASQFLLQRTVSSYVNRLFICYPWPYKGETFLPHVFVSVQLRLFPQSTS